MGALPSGNDPSYVSFPDNYNAFGAALSALAGWTQDNVMDQQRAVLQASPGWTGASGTLFASLDPTFPFPMAFAKALAESLLGSIIGVSTIDDIFDALNAWTTDFENSIAAMNAWWARLLTDLGIYLDLFHLTYPAGSPSDTKTTTISGVRTWYSSIADMLDLFGFVTSVGVPANPAADVGTAHQNLTDAVNQGVTGSSVTGADATAIGTSVSGLQSTVAGLQNQVNGLQAPTQSGANILSDTGQDSPGSGLGSNWTRTGTAAVNRDAGAGFRWSTSGSSTRSTTGIYNTPLATAEQAGFIAITQLMTYNFFNPSNPRTSIGSPYNQIILRADAASSPSSYVFARIWYDQVQFGYCASGTEHLLGSPTACVATSGTGYTFFAGDAASNYNFSLKAGGRVVASYSDSAHASSASIAGLYPGQSWTSDTNAVYGGESIPASTSWRAWDATVGASAPAGYGRLSRTGTSGVSLSGSGSAYTLPFSLFDTATLGTGITQTTSGNAGFVVSASGIYAVSAALHTASQGITSIQACACIQVNGSVVKTGQMFLGTSTGGTAISGINFTVDDAAVQLTAGDVVTVSIYSPTGGTANIVGESSGSMTCMSVSKVG